MAIVIIVVVFGLFILLREFNCWYWKINRMIRLQEKQTILLKRMLDEFKEHSKSDSIALSDKEIDLNTLNEDKKVMGNNESRKN
ncbi:MAG: hypothetical protein Q8867_02500 [Bacteroidota bacterium]|nr:hypothetical protein [Bacteroidota bacterium]